MYTTSTIDNLYKYSKNNNCWIYYKNDTLFILKNHFNKFYLQNFNTKKINSIHFDNIIQQELPHIITYSNIYDTNYQSINHSLGNCTQENRFKKTWFFKNGQYKIKISLNLYIQETPYELQITTLFSNHVTIYKQFNIIQFKNFLKNNITLILQIKQTPIVKQTHNVKHIVTPIKQIPTQIVKHTKTPNFYITHTLEYRYKIQACKPLPLKELIH